MRRYTKAILSLILIPTIIVGLITTEVFASSPTISGEFTGMESFWGYVGNVNVYNGNLVLQNTDVSLAGRGMPINVTRTYNSRSTANSVFGYGWSYNVGMRVRVIDSVTVQVTSEDGTVYRFVRSSDGSYASPSGIQLILRLESGIYTLEDKSGLKYYFDSVGRLAKMVDTNGNVTGVSYRSDETIERMTDTSGRYVAFNYTSSKLSSITGTQIPTVQYGYDSLGNLVSVKSKDNQVSYGYDNYHNITSITDSMGNVTTISYLADDRVYKVSKQTSTTTYNYQKTATGMVTTVTNSKGVATQYTTNNNGNVIKVVSDLGDGKLNLTTETTWDANNNPVQIKNPMGNVTEYKYNSKGDVETINAPDKSSAIYRYNDKSDLIDATDFAGRTSVNTYDTKTRQATGEVSPLFTGKIYRYDSTGNLLTETNPMSVGENPIPNSGFEKWTNGTLDGWVKTGTVTDDTTTQVNGSHSVKLSSATTLVTSGYITVAPQNKYTISWHVKTQDAGIATSAIYWYNANKMLIAKSDNIAATSGTTDWQRKGARVNAPANATYARVEVSVNDAGIAWFDSIQLERGTVINNGNVQEAPNAIISAYNMVENGSFEQDYSGWTKLGSSTVNLVTDIKAYNGTKSVKMSNITGWAVLTQNTFQTLQPGKTYTASAAIKTENVSGSGAVMKIDILDAVGNFLGQKTCNTVKGSNGWTRVSVSLSESEAKAMYPTAAKIRVSVGTIGVASGVMYFDAVRMSEGGTETSYTYTQDGNYIKKITNPKGESISLTTDARGNVVNATDPMNNGVKFSYDELDRIKTTENSAGLKTEYSYNGNGNVIQVTNKDNSGTTLNSASTQYNELGQVKNVTDQLGRISKIEYDNVGNLSKVILPDGRAVYYTYDALNRLIKVNDDTEVWEFSYDKDSNVTGVSKNGSSITSYTYDSRDRLTKVDNGSAYAEYQYNPVGQVLSIKNSVAEPVKFEYDQGGLNVGVYGVNGSYTAFMYDEEGRVKKSYYADNTAKVSYATYNTYDEVGHILRVRTEDNATGKVLADYSYQYDSNGNRTMGKNELDGSYTLYGYDSISQLVSEKYYTGNTLVKEMGYKYDLLGNRTQVTTVQNGQTSIVNYTYNAANELTGSYKYDVVGNLVFDGDKTYVYNMGNRLIEVRKGSNVIAKYQYDENGLRAKKETTNTEGYFYNGDKLAYITDGSKMKFYFTRDASGRLLNMVDYTGATPSTYWYIYDGHGNVVGLADKTGKVVVSYRYDAWGNITASTGSATTGDGKLLKDVNPFRYAGYQFDMETELYYLKSRYYSPTLGRFITRDVVPAVNLYAYVGNNPSTMFDPNGFGMLSDMWNGVKSACNTAAKKVSQKYEAVKAKVLNFWAAHANAISMGGKNAVSTTGDKTVAKSVSEVNPFKEVLVKAPRVSAPEIIKASTKEWLPAAKGIAKAGAVSLVGLGVSVYEDSKEYKGSEFKGAVAIDVGLFIAAAMLVSVTPVGWGAAAYVVISVGVGYGADLIGNHWKKEAFGH